MANTSALTIIDERNLRGILAPPKLIPKKLLEDIIDFIELSNPEAMDETETRIREADQKKSWLPGKEVERRLRNRMQSLR